MAFQQKPNTGSIFKNDMKTTDTQPNAKGSALIGGKEYWVSSWTKTDKNGQKYQSLAFTVKEPKAAAAPARAAAPVAADPDDAVPF